MSEGYNCGLFGVPEGATVPRLFSKKVAPYQKTPSNPLLFTQFIASTFFPNWMTVSLLF